MIDPLRRIRVPCLNRVAAHRARLPTIASPGPPETARSGLQLANANSAAAKALCPTRACHTPIETEASFACRA